MKKAILIIFLLICGNGFAQDQDASSLSRLGGASVVAAIQSEGLAGAVQLSRDCVGLVASGGQSAHYCLGVEAASMLMLRRGASLGATAEDLRWFDGDAMTERVLSYCYTALGLKGNMQCLGLMGQAKTMVMPLVQTVMADEVKR